MNVIQDNIGQIKKDFATNKPMIVKQTIIGNALMQPPSSATNKFKTPSSSRSRAKDGGQSSTSHSKSSPSVHRGSHVIVSVCEGRGKAAGIVGIAAFDIHRPVLILSQISDNQTYTATLTKLNILRPVEVLVPATFVEGAAVNRLVTAIMNHFPDLSVTSVPRSEFNRSRGIQMIQSLCAPMFSSVILQISPKFYASAASCALLRYMEQTRRVLYSPKTIKVEYQEPEDTTAIDIDTVYLLELVSNTGTQNVSLFTVLDYCSTKFGKRLLRNNILQPPCRKNVIETRQDCVQELIENPELLTRLQETLKPLFDIGASLTFGTVVPATATSVSERQLNYTLQLKGLLNAVQPLADELKVTKHPVFREIYNRFEGLDTRKKILDLISQVVNEDAHLGKGQAGELQRCFAIKSGINGFLDLSRRLYTEGVDSMREYVDELSTTYNLPLRVQHTIKNGFHIILPLTKALRNLNKTDLPPVFIKSERFSSHFYLNTMDMMNFDKRLKNNSAEIQNISNVIIYQLLVDIRPHIGSLYTLCDDVAELDVLASLARASCVPRWVRPRLVHTHTSLEAARHPVLEHLADRDQVPNDVYAYPRCNLHILTGPNMSGKTILLHTICLLQVLAQVGCWVPCARATLRLSDRVFARVTEPEASLAGSSFAQEAARLAYLLATLSDASLVVLDELCRTTAADEGVALAMAICERIARRGAFAFVASHFIAVTRLADMCPSVVNWNMETLEEYRANNTRISLKFTYKLLPGVTSIDSYGIKLSRIFTSSKSISDRAEELHKYLLPMRKSLPSESGPKPPEYLKFKLQAELDLLKIKNQLTDEIQKDKITNFQNKTGLSFEPSPLTIVRTNSNSELDRSSSNEKKTSSNSTSAGKKLSSGSNSWVPTPSNKTTISSNHEFSIPTSSKSLNLNQNSENKHIFSFDNNDENIPSASFAPEENFSFAASSIKQTGTDSSVMEQNITFPADDESSSMHKNDSYRSGDFLPVRNVRNKNLLFYNSPHCDTQSQNRNVTFSEFSEFKSMHKNSLASENSNKKTKSTFSQETNWSSAENTLINNNSRRTNLIVNSTPSTVRQKLPITLQNTSLPLISDRRNYGQSPIFQRNNSQILSASEVNLQTNKILKTPTISKNVSFSSCQENSAQIHTDISQSLVSKTDNSSSLSKTKLPTYNVPSQSSNSSSISKVELQTNNVPSQLKNVTINCGEDNLPQIQTTKFQNMSQSSIFRSSNSSRISKVQSQTNIVQQTPSQLKNVTISCCEDYPAQIQMQKPQYLNRSNIFTSETSSSLSKIQLQTNNVQKTPSTMQNVAENPCQDNTASSFKSNNSPILSKLPLTASRLDISSPILYRKRQIIPERIPETISSAVSSDVRLVSNLYDSSTESENSDENEEIESDDSVIIDEIENENDFSGIASVDELNFDTYLNLRQGVTSTPIPKENNDCYESNQYFTPNLINNTNSSSVLPPNSFIVDDLDLNISKTPIPKRKLMPQHSILPKKLQKLSVSSPYSPSLFHNSSYRTCGNSTDMSRCSTAVIIGENNEVNEFSKVVSPPNENNDVFEQDTVKRLEETEYFSPSPDNSN